MTGVYERLDICRYPMNELSEDIGNHRDYCPNQPQLIKLDAKNDTSIRSSVDTPSAFVIIMFEGFLQYHWKEKLIFYAVRIWAMIISN